MVELLGMRRGRVRRYFSWSLLGIVWGCGGVPIGLVREDDTGPSAEYFADNVTNKRSVRFKVKGEKGKTVVIEGGSSSSEGLLNDESGEAIITVALNENAADAGKDGQDHTLTAKYKDGGTLGSITVRLDTKAPKTPKIEFLESDVRIGEIAADAGGRDIVVTYEVSNVESSSVVRLYKGGSTQIAELKNVGGGTETLSAKVKTGDAVTAKVFDKAGNESKVSNALTISGVGTTSVVLGYEEVVEERVEWEEEGGVRRAELGFEFDKDLVAEEEDGYFSLRTSLKEEGLLIAERRGGGERLEARGDDVELEVGSGEWLLWSEGGDEVVYVVGVGGEWW